MKDIMEKKIPWYAMLGASTIAWLLFGFFFLTQPTSAATKLYSCEPGTPSWETSTSRQEDLTLTGTAGAVCIWKRCAYGDCVTAEDNGDGMAGIGYSYWLSAQFCAYPGQTIPSTGGWVCGFYASGSCTGATEGSGYTMTGAGDNAVQDKDSPPLSSGSWSSTPDGYQTGTGCTGSKTGGGSGDFFYQIWDGNPLTPPDPRETPTTTIVLPEDVSYSPLTTSVPFRVVTNVCEDDYPDEDPYFEHIIQAWDGDSFEDYATYNGDTFQLLIDNDCSTGLAYGQGGIPNVKYPQTFPPNDYQVKVRATFGENDPGEWSTWQAFTTTSGFLAPGGGGSWTGEGGSAQWAEAMDDALASKPTCAVFGTSWTNWDGTGLACISEWIGFMIVPQSEQFIDIVSAPVTAIIDRWPWFYIEDFLQYFYAGLNSEGTCPLVPLLGGTLFGETIPEVDPCDWFADIKTVMNDHPSITNLIIIGIWAMLVIHSLKIAADMFAPGNHIKPTVGAIWPQVTILRNRKKKTGHY